MTEIDAGPSAVSTGSLPDTTRVQALVDAAYERIRTNDAGLNASHYPALAEVPRDRFGICVVGVDGAVHSAGDSG